MQGGLLRIYVAHFDTTKTLARLSKRSSRSIRTQSVYGRTVIAGLQIVDAIRRLPQQGAVPVPIA
jgi:hypothetical protein